MLAEDDNSYEPRHRLPDLGDLDDDMQPGESPAPLPEVILFCGWRRGLHDMIIGLDEFVQRGSELWLYNEVRRTQTCNTCLGHGGLRISFAVHASCQLKGDMGSLQIAASCILSPPLQLDMGVRGIRCIASSCVWLYMPKDVLLQVRRRGEYTSFVDLAATSPSNACQRRKRFLSFML